MQLVKKFSDWMEHFRLLFRNASKEINQQIEKNQKFVTIWIEKESSWEVPSTLQAAKSLFQEKVKIFYELLDLLERTGEHVVIVVPDTNSLIAVPDIAEYRSIAEQPEYTIIFVPTVLAELDKLKVTHRDQDFRDKVSSVIT